MSSLAQPMIAPNSSVTAPTITTPSLRVGREVEHRAGPHDQVDAGGDHGRGVDERRHRGRALHRVAEPGLQRHLGGLAARGEQQQQADRGQRALRSAAARRRRRRRTRSVPMLANITISAIARPMSPTRLTTNAFLAAVAARRLVLPEPDQQVRRQADAFPADVEAEVVVGEHQQQHRRDEQVQVARRTAGGSGSCAM